MKIDPILAVKNVPKSSTWYQSIFDWNSMHGGNEFEVLTNAQDEVMLCLHKWGEHNHPTMMDSEMKNGNGIILYFRVENINSIRDKLKRHAHLVETEIALSQNSGKKEFSLRDPDGYFIIIAEHHNYQG